jgi:carbon monoxide dehydrogenase subunit G
VNLQWSGREAIAAPKDKVWAFVSDPKSVAASMPDVLDSTIHDAHNFDATVRVAVGPVRGQFKFKVEIDPQSDGERVNMKISGGGLGSVVDMTASSAIAATGPNETTLDWNAAATMRGPVATIGGRVLDAQAHKLIEQTFTNVKTRVAGAAAP